MKRSIGVWQLIGFAFTSLVGTLLHFLYDWLGKSKCAALISGVNESTWEHMKLLFMPMLFFALIQRLFFREREDFWRVKRRGILLGISLIPIIFYTYNGAIGKSPDFINIAIFFISAAIAYVYEARLFRSERLRCTASKRYLATILAIAALFVIFTFWPLEIGIFEDPLTGSFGI